MPVLATYETTNKESQSELLKFALLSVGNHMFKVNNRNARTRCEIGSKLTIKTPERPYCRRSSVFSVTFEHISNLAFVVLLLPLSR